MRYVPIINLLNYSIKDLKTGKIYNIYEEVIYITKDFKIYEIKRESPIIEKMFQEIINDLNLFDNKQLGFENIRHKSYVLDILIDIINFEIGINKFLTTFEENVPRNDFYVNELLNNANKIKENLSTLIIYYF